ERARAWPRRARGAWFEATAPRSSTDHPIARHSWRIIRPTTKSYNDAHGFSPRQDQRRALRGLHPRVPEPDERPGLPALEEPARAPPEAFRRVREEGRKRSRRPSGARRGG